MEGWPDHTQMLGHETRTSQLGGLQLDPSTTGRVSYGHLPSLQASEKWAPVLYVLYDGFVFGLAWVLTTGPYDLLIMQQIGEVQVCLPSWSA